MANFTVTHRDMHPARPRGDDRVAGARSQTWLLELLTHIDIAAAVERENTCCDDIRWRLLLLPFAQPAPSLCQISSVSWLLC